MLKIEDLKEGDELEFISDKDREEFISYYSGNIDLVYNCFNSGIGKVIGLSHRAAEFDGIRENRLGCIYNEELKYFRKVETKKEVVDTPEVESTYVNANIKSYEESYTRMMKGEVFYFKGSEVYYDKEYGNFKFGDKLLGPYKSEFEHFQVKKPWYEFASEENPILCKVWNTDPDDFKYDHVEGKDTLSFISKCNGHVRYATPVKPSECFQGG